MKWVWVLVVNSVMSLSAWAEQVNCDKTCQSRLVNAYHQGIDQISRKGSSVADVDRFLDGLHPQVQYSHPEYDSEFNKTLWRQAFLRQLNAGRYTGDEQTATHINHIIHGYQHAAVEKIQHYYDDEGNLISTPPRLEMFEFKEGKIFAIRDHWYHLNE